MNSVKMNSIEFIISDRQIMRTSPDILDKVSKFIHYGIDEGYFYEVTEWHDVKEMETHIKFYPTDICPMDTVNNLLEESNRTDLYEANKE